MRRLMCLFPLLMLCAEPVWAQFPGGSDFRRRILERMDRNGNGSLDPGEVSERAQGFLERMAGGPVDLRRSISIASILDGNAGRAREGRRSTPQQPEDPYPVLARFGEATRFSFGIDPGLLDGRIVQLEKRYDERVLDSVRRSMERYDKNDNGVLEHAEWSTMRWRNDPRESDLDRDGVLTQAELAEQIVGERSSDRDRRSSGRSRGFRGESETGGSRRDRGREGEGRLGRGGFDRRDFGRGGFGRGDSGRGDFGRGDFGRGDAGRRGRGGFFGGPFGGRGPDGGREGPRGGDDEQRGRGRRGSGMFAAMLGRMDRDGDGTIHPDEIDDRFRGMASRVFERLGLDPSAPVSLDEIRARAESGDDGQSARRRRGQTPQEVKPKAAYLVQGAARFGGRDTYAVGEGPKLPDGLPSWWSRRDRNRDGSVTMAEFLDGETSNRRIDEFLDYDFNDDGVITPSEGKSAAAEK